MSINRLPSNNNRFDVSKLGKASAGARAGKAAAAGAAAGAAKASGANQAGKSEDVLKLSSVAGQAGEAPQISLSGNAPIPKSEHADALLKASGKLSPETRADEALKLMAMDLVDHMFQDVA